MVYDEMVYDAVICVSPKHTKIAVSAIRSLKQFTEVRKIFVITSFDNFSFFNKKFNEDFSVILCDEDLLIEGTTLASIKTIIAQRKSDQGRAGWYFQQFLKMASSELEEIAEYYLIWDSDTILLKKVDFFSIDRRILVNPKTENHKPYFQLIHKLLDIEKQVDFSFISEHLMVKREYMRILLETLRSKASEGVSWIELILESIDNESLGKSGFSEYETYGNFSSFHFKGSYQCRSLVSSREGAKIFGQKPDKYAIFFFMRKDYEFVTFEFGHGISRRKLLVNKIYARYLYFLSYFHRGLGHLRRVASAIET